MTYGMGSGSSETPRTDSWTSQPDGEAYRNYGGRSAGRVPRSPERPCVLFIDDEPHDREIYGRILCYNGFDVAFAGTGEEALQLAERHAVAAVVLDLGLPDVPGLVLLQRLRALPSMRAVPVIVLSAFAHDEMAAKARQQGCARYVEKPASPVTVFHAVEELVGRPPLAGVGRLPRIIDGPDDFPCTDGSTAERATSLPRPGRRRGQVPTFSEP